MSKTRRKKSKSTKSERDTAIDLLFQVAEISDGKYHVSPLHENKPGGLKRVTKAVRYIRVSTEDQAQRFSLAAQRDTIAEFGKKHNFEWVGPIFEDHCSAKSMYRPAWLQLLEFLRTHPEIEAIVVITPDRLSRVFSESSFAADRLAQAGIAIVACDTYSPHSSDFLTRSILALMAQNENMKRGKSVAAGVKKKTSLGHVHGRPPYGYQYVPKDGYAVLEPHPTRSKTVKRIFELARTTTLGLEAIRERILSETYDTENLPVKMERIIKNEVYMGKMRLDTSSPNYTVTDAVHKPIVSKKVWLQANNRWTVKKTSRVKEDELAADVAVTGLMRCSCGRNLYPMRKHHNLASGPKVYHYLFCKTCRINHRMQDIENELIELFDSLVFKQENFELFKALIQKHVDQLEHGTKDRLQDQQAVLDKVTKKIKRVKKNYLDGQLEAEDYREFSATLEQERHNAETNLDKLKQQSKPVKVESLDCLTVLSKIGTIYKSSDSEMKRLIITSFLGEHVDPSNLAVGNSVIDFIFERKPAPDLKRSRNSLGDVKSKDIQTKKPRKKKRTELKVWREPRSIKRSETLNVINKPSKSKEGQKSRLTRIETPPYW